MAAHVKKPANQQAVAAAPKGVDSLTWGNAARGDDKSSMVVHTPGTNASPPSAPTGVYRIVEPDC